MCTDIYKIPNPTFALTYFTYVVKEINFFLQKQFLNNLFSLIVILISCIIQQTNYSQIGIQLPVVYSDTCYAFVKAGVSETKRKHVFLFFFRTKKKEKL